MGVWERHALTSWSTCRSLRIVVKHWHRGLTDELLCTPPLNGRVDHCGSHLRTRTGEFMTRTWTHPHWRDASIRVVIDVHERTFRNDTFTPTIIRDSLGTRQSMQANCVNGFRLWNDSFHANRLLCLKIGSDIRMNRGQVQGIQYVLGGRSSMEATLLSYRYEWSSVDGCSRKHCCRPRSSAQIPNATCLVAAMNTHTHTWWYGHIMLLFAKLVTAST
jgi:hypothetical protein